MKRGEKRIIPEVGTLESTKREKGFKCIQKLERIKSKTRKIIWVFVKTPAKRGAQRESVGRERERGED